NGKTNAARAVQNIDAAANALDRFRKIIRPPFEENRPLLMPKEMTGEIEQCFARNRLAGGAQRAADAKGCRQTGFEVKIAGAVRPGAGDQAIQIHGPRLTSRVAEGKRRNRRNHGRVNRSKTYRPLQNQVSLLFRSVRRSTVAL